MLAPNATSITLTSLTSFDWFLVVIAVVSALFAFQRGFIRVLFSLVGLGVGVVLASWNYLPFARWLHRWITSPVTAQAIAFLGILFAVLIAFGLAAGLVRQAAKAVGLGFADRLLGAALGLLRGVLLGAAAMMALAAFDPHSEWVQNSVLAPYFLAGAHGVSFVVPQRFQEQMTEGTRHLLENKPAVMKRN